MQRYCSGCDKRLTPQELCKRESQGMEAERKELGLRGLLFRCYDCEACGHADIFVDLYPLEGETAEEFRQRREDLESAIGTLETAGVAIRVIDRSRVHTRPIGMAAPKHRLHRRTLISSAAT
jgi:hypothetical protein